MKLHVWRLHPKSVRLVRANCSLNGLAHPVGSKLCRPYAEANQSGFWVYPSYDLDVVWRGGSQFEHRLFEPFDDADHKLISELAPNESQNVKIFCPVGSGRTKLSWGLVEPAVLQYWTGCIFQTPPDWSLHFRSPVNFSNDRGYRVMEGIVETEWLQYDIWLNLVFYQKDNWIKFRVNDPEPIAQIVPVLRTQVSEGWEIGRDEFLNKSDGESERVFNFWLEYNKAKYCEGGQQPASHINPDLKKDGTTYFKKRKKHFMTQDNS